MMRTQEDEYGVIPEEDAVRDPPPRQRPGMGEQAPFPFRRCLRSEHLQQEERREQGHCRVVDERWQDVVPKDQRRDTAVGKRSPQAAREHRWNPPFPLLAEDENDGGNHPEREEVSVGQEASVEDRVPVCPDRALRARTVSRDERLARDAEGKQGSDG